ncbi:MAG TPA: TorF family putative porin [Luteibacter sp.]|jgi:uncharacterized protein (TIGR02001 family)|nr:TorF family putative porin [Luteibacter sp.]
MTERRPFCVNRGRRPGVGALSIALVAAWLVPPLHAQSSNLTGVVGISSQLVDRGVANSPATPILQGAVSWTSPTGWSLGLSASTQVRSPGQAAETVAQVSHYWLVSENWQFRAGLLYYGYAGDARSKVYDRAETGISWIYRDMLTFGLSAIYVVGAGDSQPKGAADINFLWPLAWHFSLSLGAGLAQPLEARYSHHYGRDSDSPYSYGQAGLRWANGDWRLELARIMSDQGRQPRGGLRTSPWVATVTWSF